MTNRDSWRLWPGRHYRHGKGVRGRPTACAWGFGTFGMPAANAFIAAADVISIGTVAPSDGSSIRP
jgi:hypothetical protein